MPEPTIQTDVAPEEAVVIDGAAEVPVVATAEVEKTDDDPEPEPVERQLTDREIMQADMTARRKLEREGQAPELQEPELPEPGVQVDPAEQMVALKVNGEEVLRTQAEVDAAGGVAAIQKSLSGDQKLALAAQEKKQLQEREQVVNQVVEENRVLRQEMGELRSLVQVQTTKKVEQTPEAIAARREKAKSITQKFFVGDSSELEVAIDELLSMADQPHGQAPAPVVDEAAIARRVERQMDVETDRKDAVKLFTVDHADLNSVPGRRDYVDQKTLEVQRAHPDWKPSQIISEAVELTRAELNIPRPVPGQTPAPTTLEERRRRKEASTDTIASAHERVKAPSTQTKVKTAEEIFEEIQAKRSHR